MRSFIAFIITVTVYLLLIWLYLSNLKEIVVPKPLANESVIKIDIYDLPLPPKVEPKKAEPIIQAPKKIIPPKKIEKKVVKRAKKKPIIKKKPKAQPKKKRVEKKKVKKRIIKPKKPKVTTTKKKKSHFIEESEMIYIPDPMIKTTQPVEAEDDLSYLLNFHAKPQPKVNNYYPSPKVKKLYGSEFHSYTPAQKKFIENNLDSIHKITQNVLWRRGYPGGAVSARTGQEGQNIVSFYLHPNGDISGLHLKKKVGYRSLDDNTLETIKSAYKDYPYPSEKTKMIFYVEYSIFGY